MNLLSGATGLVGAHLLAQLILNKAKTRALYRTEEKKEQAIAVVLNYSVSEDDISEHVEWMQCDILDIPKLEAAFDRITHVYHCAGFISNSPSDYKMMRKVNIEGTANMVNLSTDFNVIKFCHVSSIAALGTPLVGEAVTEETPMAEDQKPSAYEISKYGAEMEVWRASQEGLDVVIVNPGIILGDGFYDSGSGTLLMKLKQGLKFYPPKKTGFVGVYDVSKAMIQLMSSSIVNQRFVLVSENLSFKEVGNQFSKLYKTSPPKIEVKPWMLYLAWCFEVLRSFFTSYKRQLTLEVIPGLFEDSLYSSEKIKQELNFKFESLEEYSKTIHQRS
ncbi:SDR family oxidoreductase [Psychroflexus montanilacus]|uniref:SDR family oxidoreductase n=1 Tax=Psychroflexus montanilacus TaxID=2873598 RepID=UPI001CC913B1|nr:SDR family oxidoreductase [Psychroflexus montanilacus]MBZ9651533.1 SDR family oxidoreductase [Psychroflexus montanilacus]